MTESAGRWLAREVLVLVGLYGLLLSATLYALGLGLASVDVIIAVTGQQLPALLAAVGRWGLVIFMAGEGVLLVSGWLLRQGTHSHDGQAGGQQGKDAA